MLGFFALGLAGLVLLDDEEETKLQKPDTSFLYGLEKLNGHQARRLYGEIGEELSGLAGDQDVYEIITNMMLEKIEKAGELPWRKPWSNTYNLMAMNYDSKKPYRGLNAVILNFTTKKENPYWLTFKQVVKHGGKIKKGARSEMVMYFEMIYKLAGKRITSKEYWKYFGRCAEGEVIEDGIEVCKELRSYPMLRYYRVFNGDDIEGIDWQLPDPEELKEVERIAQAEKIVAGMPNRPPIRHKENSAFYMPSQDYVNMPKIGNFEKEEYYYSTLFHELVHSTKHKSRLDAGEKRPRGNKFGDINYSREELVAELGAAFLCGESGILFHTMNNSAAYLKSWRDVLIRHLKEDKKFILNASSLAQAAADYILDVDPNKIKPVKVKTKKAKQAKSKEIAQKAPVRLRKPARSSQKSKEKSPKPAKSAEKKLPKKSPILDGQQEKLKRNLSIVESKFNEKSEAFFKAAVHGRITRAKAEELLEPYVKELGVAKAKLSKKAGKQLALFGIADKLDPESEIQMGMQALDKVIESKQDIYDAFVSPLIGSVSLIYGKEGDPENHFNHGFGISHILAKRDNEGQTNPELKGQKGIDVAQKLIEVLVNGEIKAISEESGRVTIEKDGYQAEVRLQYHDKKITWLLTGFKIL